MTARARRTAKDYSRGLRSLRHGIDVPRVLAGLLVVAAVAGPILLIVSDFLTLFEAKAVTVVLRTVGHGVVKGHTSHSYAMVLIGVAAIPMALGAVRAGSRPAMVALAALGAVAAVIALGFDLPDATGSNPLETVYAGAKSQPGIGFYLETLGAALLLIAGGGSLVLAGSERAAAGPTLQRRKDPAAAPEASSSATPEPSPGESAFRATPADHSEQERTAAADRSEQERAAAAAARAEARSAGKARRRRWR